MDKDSLLISDVLDMEFTASGLGSLHRHLDSHLQADHESYDLDDEAPMQPSQSLLASTLRPLRVRDHATRSLMVTVKSLPRGTEWLLHECKGGCLDDTLAALALQARKRFLPRHSFRRCAVLRGTLGHIAPIGSVRDESYILLWEKSKKPK